MRPFAAAVSLAAFLPQWAGAQDALELLNRVAANYKTLAKTTYDFEQVERRELLSGSLTVTERRQRIAGSQGRFREQQLPSGTLYLFDSQFLWVYDPDRNEYAKRSFPRPSLDAFSLVSFELANSRVKSARFLRQESVDLVAGPVLCQVIEVERDPSDSHTQESSKTYWIDAGRNLVLKFQYTCTIQDAARPNPSVTKVTIWTPRAAVGQPVDEALFRFNPPEGSVEVERLTFAPKSPLLGTDAPELELEGSDGKPITAAGLRGRAVLLQLGSLPGEDSPATLEMIRRALASNGLAVFYVKPQSPVPAPVSTYAVPAATDPGGKAAKSLGITFTGTVLIDRQGKIAYFGTPMGISSDLVHALQTAGVW
jgi:outer membrane lipoprotein-sorting protein